MTAIVIACALIVVFSFAFVHRLWLLSFFQRLFGMERRFVLLHHKELEQPFEGLWDGRFVNGHYVLDSPVVGGVNNQRTHLSGKTMLHKSKVAFVQELDAPRAD